MRREHGATALDGGDEACGNAAITHMRGQRIDGGLRIGTRGLEMDRCALAQLEPHDPHDALGVDPAGAGFAGTLAAQMDLGFECLGKLDQLHRRFADRRLQSGDVGLRRALLDDLQDGGDLLGVGDMDGVEPGDLRIDELLRRVEANGVQEVVLAMNPNMTGEATAGYLADRLRGQTRVTRLASGLPVGGDLEYADELTLGRALEGRRELAG